MGRHQPSQTPPEGTIRKLFAASIERNCVHGSRRAQKPPRPSKIPFFFAASETAVALAPSGAQRKSPDDFRQTEEFRADLSGPRRLRRKAG